jgi:hypothetical protein
MGVGALRYHPEDSRTPWRYACIGVSLSAVDSR